MAELSRAEKKIVRARVGMIVDEPFFGHIAMQLILVERETMNPPTMATDGYRLYYHPDYVMSISDEELQGVIAHEVGHIALMHMLRRGNRERWRWNYACDFAVNDLVTKEFQLPQGILLNPEFSDQTAEWIYSKLPENQEKELVITLDSHAEWDENGEGDGEGGDGEGDGDGTGDQDTGSSPDSKEGLEQHIREMVAQSAVQARMKGKLPAHLQELVDGTLQPKLGWKAILRDTIVSCAKSDFTLYPPNKKHIYRGFILPGITGTEINIACVFDTSGSISSEEMNYFLSELKGICDQYDEYTIYLRTCDTVIHQKWELHPFTPVPTILEGRGGTSFIEALEEADNLPITSLVYMTDGYGSFPDKEPRFPVIWVSTTDAEYPWGRVIRLPDITER